jgi:hypothetical protein
VDAEQVAFAVVGLELLEDDDDSTISSYSDDDSTIESLEDEGETDFSLGHDYEIPLNSGTNSRRRKRRPSIVRLEGLREALEQHNLRLTTRRTRRTSRRAEDETGDEDSVVLARSRVRCFASDAMEEDSLRLSRTRVSPCRKSSDPQQRYDEEDLLCEDEYPILEDFSMPLSSGEEGALRNSRVGFSSSRRKP